MATAVDYGSEEQAMQAYFREGAARAFELGNRGPLRLTADGKLHPDVADAFERCGFYVFEGVIAPGELAELEADYLDLMDRLPTDPGARFDHKGRPALGADDDAPALYWARPLSDPFGGTERVQGRHSVKMFEPQPAAITPDQIVFSIVSPLECSDAFLRLCGHPRLLHLAAALCGKDFVPFQEAFVIKRPGEGASFSWHQDGATHWNDPDWTQHSHGVNFMPQLYGSTPANGVWFVPGTQAMGKLDIRAMVERSGSERLPDAVPLICGPGDVAISNRQVVHGSFANTSPDCRVTLAMGCFARRWVQGVTGYDLATNAPRTYDAQWIDKRCEMIGYAIDARRQHFSDETPFTYQPHAMADVLFRWDEAARQAIRGYYKYDLRI